MAASTNPADTARLDAVLGAHPRLGAKKVESALSRAEQAQLQRGGGGGGGGGEERAEKEKEELRRLNEEYEERFPGLRYVYVVS